MSPVKKVAKRIPKKLPAKKVVKKTTKQRNDESFAATPGVPEKHIAPSDMPPQSSYWEAKKNKQVLQFNGHFSHEMGTLSFWIIFDAKGNKVVDSVPVLALKPEFLQSNYTMVAIGFHELAKHMGFHKSIPVSPGGKPLAKKAAPKKAVKKVAKKAPVKKVVKKIPRRA